MSSLSNESSQSYESGTDQTMCEAVVSAVADAEGVDEMELERPLYDAVDPDALDRVFRGSDGWITFEYYGYIVSVDADRNVELSAVGDIGGADRL